MSDLICRFLFRLLIIFPALFQFAFAQSSRTLVAVNGLPTNEVFDLLVDRKGFLWVGHDMGISRFDGVAFTHFAHPQRSSLSITDLIEDPQGRIWCHNFTGQIFYIEDERMHLLEAFKNEREPFFARIGLCGSDIIATSKYGLFVWDTKSMQGQYVTPVNDKETSTSSLTVVGNKVVAVDLNRWYLYSKKEGMKRISLSSKAAIPMGSKSFKLQPKTYNDTIYLVTAPTGSIYKIMLEGDHLDLKQEFSSGQFINSVLPVDDGVWVNTKIGSLKVAGKNDGEQIAGYNISDIVTDQQGNTWYSSLNKGLLVEAKADFIKKAIFPGIQPGDRVSNLGVVGDTMLVGTQSGNIYLLSRAAKNILWQAKLPDDRGGISLIYGPFDGNFLISTSTESLLFDYRKKLLKNYIKFTVKDVQFHNGHLLLSAPTGLYATSLANIDSGSHVSVADNYREWNDYWRSSFIKLSSKHHKVVHHPFRTRSLTYDKDNDLLYVSFMNGVYKFSKTEVLPLITDGKKIYSNSLVTYGHKVYVSTLNRGLFIFEQGKFKNIDIRSGLFSNSIVKIKVTGKYLWILQDRAIQVLDMNKDLLIDNIELPQESGPNVHDVDMLEDMAYVTTSNQVYSVLMKPSPQYLSLHSYLKLVLVNKSDTIAAGRSLFAYNQNDIQFFLSVPWYNPSNNIYFKYRLKGASNDNQWYTTQPGERSIRFASLMPGSYTFESYAVVAGFQERRANVFSFTIKKPWWQTHLFIALVILLAGLLFWGLYLMRVRQVLKLDQVRRTISSDLHDEIGSTISSINIYSELAKSEKDNQPYLKLIQENTQDVISKLDDLVWSINPKNDTVDQLLVRMRSFAEPVLTGAGIQPHFTFGDGLEAMELPLATKRNLYLIFKELVNNVVKHSKAGHCQIMLEQKQAQLCLLVADDGVGISDKSLDKGRSGMTNLSERARQIKATLSFERFGTGGTKALLQVSLK